MSNIEVEAPLHEQPMNGPSFRQSWANFFATVGAICSGTMQGVAPLVVPVTGSPCVCHVSVRGTLAIIGGAVAGVRLTRAKTSLDLGGVTILPVLAGDSVSVFYTAAPSVQFLAG